MRKCQYPYRKNSIALFYLLGPGQTRISGSLLQDPEKYANKGVTTQETFDPQTAIQDCKH